MKTFNEAMNILKTNISNYQKLCQKANHQVLSDEEAFFRNLIPFGKRYGGRTGFLRAEKFLSDIEEAIEKRHITKTEQLIDFAANYREKGNTLSDFIWKSVREVAGFREIHINFLIPIYQDANGGFVGRYYEEPSRKESQLAIERLFNRAICGHYEDELQKYLRSHLGLKSNACTDYGKKLLNNLNSKVKEVELDIIDQTALTQFC